MTATVKDLGINIVPASISRYGTIVGTDNASGPGVAFMYSGGTLKLLGKLPGDASSSANDVNSSNEAVGVSYPSSGSHAVLFKSGTVINLDKAGSATATAINDNGEMVGYDASGRGVIFDGKGGTTSIGSGFGCTPIRPLAVNSHGEIVGSACVPAPPPPDSVSDAFKYPPFGKVNYPSDYIAEDDYTAAANDVNANGDVAGFYPNGTGYNGAFLTYASGRSIELPTVLDLASAQYRNTQADGINAGDWVVGTSNAVVPQTPQEAILFITNKTYDLNWLVPRTSGWFLSSAQDVNDNGQIVCVGANSSGREHGFLITVTKM